MKRIMIIIALLTLAIAPVSATAGPWHRQTKHKTVKRMKREQVRKAQNEKSMYYRNHRGKTVKR